MPAERDPTAGIHDNYFIFSKLVRWFILCLMGIGQSSAVRILVAEEASAVQESEHMRSHKMAALEEKLRGYEDELMRLRVENEQLRQSSQAFGELAERLSVALRTAARVNRRHATAADSGGRRCALAES
jgi:chromosome segregation ATPase